MIEEKDQAGMAPEEDLPHQPVNQRPPLSEDERPIPEDTSQEPRQEPFKEPVPPLEPPVPGFEEEPSIPQDPRQQAAGMPPWSGAPTPPVSYPPGGQIPWNSPQAGPQGPTWIPEPFPYYSGGNAAAAGAPYPQPSAGPREGAFPMGGQEAYRQPYPYGPNYRPAPWGAPYPQKRKLSLGLKVFLWIASVVAAGAILGFAAFLVYSSVTNSYGSPYTLPVPEEGMPPKDEEENPDYDDNVIPPEDEEDDSNRPQVDITPNHQGITILQRPKGEELDAQEVYERVAKSTVTVAATLKKNGQESHSTGTGIIATSDGYIITNSHVVLNSKSSTVEVTTLDEQTYDAVVVGVDRTTDLAVIKTNDYDFAPAEFGDAEELAIGEWVIAIGNPGGARFSSSLTRGVISGLNRTVGKYSENGMTYIQTDAAINPGNSGGPLVNMHGQVVGINSSKIITDGYEGMGFAIPVSKAQAIINELLSGGYVKGRTRLGITASDITPLELYYGMPNGLKIVGIDENSAFTGTEAQVGDIITAVNDEEITGLTDLANLLLKYAPGDQVTMTLYRMPGTNFVEGKEFQVTVVLLEDKGETQN